MSPPLSLNCFILGDDSNEIFDVNIMKNEKVSFLKKLIKEERSHSLNHIDASALRLWKFNLPFSDIPDADDLVAGDALQPVKKISSIFPDALVDEHIHIIIKSPSVGERDDTESAVKMLEQKHSEFFKCLTVNVAKALSWTKNDVVLNNGVFVDERDKPQDLKNLESRLHNKRIFNPLDDNHNLTVARTCSQFSMSYVTTSTTIDQASVKNHLEFLAFYSLSCCYIPDALRYKEPESASIKATAMKSNFILPPFFWAGKSTDTLAYNEELSWRFPMFVKCDAMARLPRKYTPRNDFCVWFEKSRSLALPLIIGEVVSFKDEKDRYRMLLQAIALARLLFALQKSGSSEPPFIVAVYLTEHMTAERYIVMKLDSESDKVLISHKEFDLAKENDAVSFQREMYNLASILESVINELDPEKCNKLEAIKADASGMKSLHTSGAWKKTDKSKSKGGRMRSIPEEGDTNGSGKKASNSDPQDEDDLGVFGNDNISAALDRMNLKVAYVAYGYPHLAPVIDCKNGELVACLKFVKDEANEEIEILQYFAGLRSEFNNCVQPFGIWPVTGGSIIAMPAAGNDLTSLTDLNEHLWSLTKQLFQAIKFMHDHNVAHLDLKPANILVPSPYGRLTIVDFGLSVRLRDKTQLVEGYGGTEGYIAPEVGKTEFSPIRADLWSVGTIVKELCMLCRPSASRDRLLFFSEQLLNNDPNKRPTMSEVLEWMLNLDAPKIQPDDPPSSVTSMSSGFVSVNA